MNLSPQFAFLTFTLHSGEEVVSWEPFLHTTDRTEAELNAVVATLEESIERFWSDRDFNLGVRVENSSSASTGRLLFLRERLDFIAERGPDEVFGRHGLDYYHAFLESAEKALSFIDDAKPHTCDTYYLLVDRGEGFQVCAKIDSLTVAEFDHFFSIWSKYIYECNSVPEWVSVAAASQGPIRLIEAELGYEDCPAKAVDDRTHNPDSEEEKQVYDNWELLFAYGYAHRVLEKIVSNRGIIDYQADDDEEDTTIVYGGSSGSGRVLIASIEDSQAATATKEIVQSIETPKLSPSESRIIEVLQEANQRLTTSAVLQKLEAKHGPTSTGMTKSTLAQMVRYGHLNNASDNRGKGYGLTSWS